MRVGLFVTCLVSLMRPSIGFAALKLLEAAGCEVVVPPAQTCCGQPGYNSGDRASALALARKVLAEFEDCDYVVAPSGSCAGMIRTHYPDLFSGEPRELERVRRLCEERQPPIFAECRQVRRPSILQRHVTYHDSCSNARDGREAQPRAACQSCGIDAAGNERAKTCCSFGGTFAVKFGEISTRLADYHAGTRCDRRRRESLGDVGCMLNIEGCLRRRGRL